MSDPVSVAGTAVGVVSFGLILCQGLTDYLQALECRKEDIESTSRQVDCLQGALNVIKFALPKLPPDQQNARAVVERCLQSCEDEMERLAERLDNLKDQAPSDSLNQKLRLQARKLAYPFKQGSLRRLEDSVLKINQILSTAVQAVGLNVSGAQLETLSLVATKSETTAHNVSSVMDSVSTLNSEFKSFKSMLSRNDDRTVHLSSMIEQSVPKIRDEISTAIPQIQSTLPRIELSVTEAASNSSSMNQTLTVMSQDIGRVETKQDLTMVLVHELLSSLHQSQSQSQNLARIGSLEKVITGQRLPSLPSLDSRQEISDDIDWPQSQNRRNVGRRKHDRRHLLPRTGARDFKSSICICHARYASEGNRYLFAAMSLFYSRETFETHLPQCPFYTCPQQIRKLGARFQSVGSLLSTAILATISIHTGASGFSINSHLSFQAVVPSDSPAFVLFSKKYYKSLYSEFGTHDEILNSIMPKLLRLFVDRRASPRDVNSYGQTLLHVALQFLGQLGVEDLRSLESFRQLVLSLLNSGVPADTYDAWGTPPLNDWLDTTSQLQFSSPALLYGGDTWAMTDVLSELIGNGPEYLTPDMLSGVILNHGMGSYMIRCFLKTHDFAQICQCGSLTMAILRRSEQDVRHILAKVPSSLNERNVCGQTPLHISCGWPLGIKLLLEAGAQDIIDCIDDFGFSAFAYASEFSGLEGLEMLIEAECSFFPNKPYLREHRDFRCFEKALEYGSQDTQRRLIQSLASKRESLKALALDNLTLEEVAKFNLCDNTILDERAYDVSTALKASAVKVSESLAVPSSQTCVYHLYPLSTELAEQFYERGFHNIDAFNEGGLTPLMNWHPKGLELDYWLLSHGADLYATPNTSWRHCMNSDATAAHYLGYKIAQWFGSKIIYSQGFVLDPKAHDLAKLLCSISNPDSCSCGCSSKGCHPVTMMFKEYCGNLNKDWNKPRRFSLIGQIMRHIPLIDEARCWLPVEAIRFFTFETLGIRHSCCEFRAHICRWWEEEEEIEELREEDRFRLQLFEKLLAEFEEKYTELGVGLVEFFEGYWLKRMKKVRKRPAEADEEGVRRLTEIGVILDEDEADLSDEDEADLSD